MAPHPCAGPSLGPQEVEVYGMDARHGHPGGTCAAPPPGALPPQQQQLALTPQGGGGVRPLEKRPEMRDVHISVALMNDFLHYAATNTRRGIESCGILAGSLSAGDSVFRVTTLIIPKQEGTSDTVAALNEEEIFEAQFSRELYPLGWIHTHPTQTCFLSSVDVHTQCGYQTMLDEAVAVVMAPTDRRNKCGIFRLTTPGGLGLVQKCPLRGFHTHPDTETGQEVYELCGHVYLNPRTKHEVLDLR
ncbi:MAG: JAB1/Mov34/MPN/PAD-1 ubiquitin protease-domain-containing protein [Monoraphidium minutum]|nr:MAG: JAB1/Mov34/MPN/PAD-1 ubiquitin protease-domain-containing protein [Monoraphidium minutum]